MSSIDPANRGDRVSYCWLRTRAILNGTENSRDARPQATMLNSSESVRAMKNSASSIPAWRSRRRSLPLPVMTMQSRWLSAYLAVSASRSIRVTSWLSAMSCLASWKPVLPAPTTTIFRGIEAMLPPTQGLYNRAYESETLLPDRRLPG